MEFNIEKIWGSGVNRWHASRWPALRNSGDTTDAHQGRCVRLLLCLHPAPSVDLLAAVACHDVQECMIGDMPDLAKRGKLGSALDKREVEVACEWGLPIVTGNDKNWLRLVDMLDAYLWAKTIDRRIVAESSWRNKRKNIVDLANKLDCCEYMIKMLDD